MRQLPEKSLLCALIVAASLSASGCPRNQEHIGLSELNKMMALEARLAEADFSLVDSNPSAVAMSWNFLTISTTIPETIVAEFSGSTLLVPEINRENAIGITYSDGRIAVIYTFDDITNPAYGEIKPLALAHYHIENPNLDIVLLLVVFQTDPDGSLAGIGVKSLGMDGIEMSAPFAVAVKPDELTGIFFYDSFINGGINYGVAARKEWNRGFILLTRSDPDTILSTYLPWY